MADYRDLAAALSGGYGQDTGGITPDTLITLKNGKKASATDLLGMLKAIGSGSLSNLESLGRGGLSQFLGAPVDTANTIRTPYPMEVFGDVNYTPDKQLLGGSRDILGMMPRGTATRPETAGMEELGGFMAPATAKVLKPVAKSVVRMAGQEIANVSSGMPSRSLLGDITPKPLMAVEPQMQMAQAITKPKAEVSPLGFYSAVEQQALNIPRKQGTGASFLNELAKGQDVKKYEMEAMGLDEFLKGKPNVTRQEVQDFIQSNKIDVQEVRLGGNEQPSQDLLNWMSARNISPPRNPEGWQELSQKLESYAQQHQKAQGAPEASQRYFTLSEEAGRISEGLDAGGSSSGATKYQKYQLAGGENYREILLKLPQKETRTPNMIEYEKLGQQMFGGSLNPTERARLDELENLLSREERSMALSGGKSKTSVYQSSHFDEPNILAHIRVNDRVDADGKKMLLVEEIQSDWHQAGRESGYAPKNAEAQLAASRDRMAERSNEIRRISNRMAELNDSQLDEFNALAQDRQRLQDLQNEETEWGNRIYDAKNSGVPDAPFKDTWYQLALKRAIKEAVDKGYDRIGLTTGKQQVNRFSNELRQNVDEINFNPIGTQDQIIVNAKKNGQNTFSGTIKDGKFIDGQAQGKTVEEVLGKTMAKQIAEKKDGVIKGDDLTIGGEGMKKYYDEIYPAFLNKQGKKYGAQVGETQIPTDRSTIDGMSSMYPNKETVRYLDITPEMRKAIKEGQPLASIQNELAKALA